jgi:purine-nucleoside phosphorylase
MSELYRRIEETRSFIQKHIKEEPTVGIILGTGLGGLAQKIENKVTISYEDIPHFWASTVVSHAGELVLGTLAGKSVVAMQGRFHYYEGYSLEEITFPVRVMKALGVSSLVVSNASGALNPLYKAGDLVIISDHINLMGVNPLVGLNDERLGVRFPDMSEPYWRSYLDVADKVALDAGIKVHRGVYVGVTGPCLETAAEYRFMRMIGSDLVGMSTVPEVIVAVHAGLKVFAISCVTDMCLPDALKPANIEEIIEVAKKAEPSINTIVQGVIREL